MHAWCLGNHRGVQKWITARRESGCSGVEHEQAATIACARGREDFDPGHGQLPKWDSFPKVASSMPSRRQRAGVGQACQYSEARPMKEPLLARTMSSRLS
jgi:hypothetical protein